MEAETAPYEPWFPSVMQERTCERLMSITDLGLKIQGV